MAHQPDGFELRRRAMVRDYGRGCNLAGLGQCLTTLLPLALLWWLAAWSLAHRPWLAIPATLCITLYLVRVFALMHECGHGALFSSRPANRVAGFVMGVISGMPQYVWAQHHDHHHRTNGNWERYRGPLTTASVDEYAAMSPAGRRRYRLSRHIALAPLGGFVYLVFNPRCNWLKGSLALGLHLLGGRPVADFRTRYWKTWREYLHMTANNVVLLSLWWAMSQAIGVGPFFAIYLTSLSLAGGIGIMLFTVQHNFEHAYAAPTATWDFDAGAMRGTSFLVLPGWLNWFTANIGYHHVHHLSAAIPNYHLVKCHSENADLFGSVRRLRLADVPGALQCLLWDRRGERIISFAQYEAEAVAAQPRQRPRIPGR